MDSVSHVLQVMVMLKLVEKQSMGSVLFTIVQGITIRTVKCSWDETNANNVSKAFTWMNQCVVHPYLLAVWDSKTKHAQGASKAISSQTKATACPCQTTARSPTIQATARNACRAITSTQKSINVSSLHQTVPPLTFTATVQHVSRGCFWIRLASAACCLKTVFVPLRILFAPYARMDSILIPIGSVHLCPPIALLPILKEIAPNAVLDYSST